MSESVMSESSPSPGSVGGLDGVPGGGPAQGDGRLRRQHRGGQRGGGGAQH